MADHVHEWYDKLHGSPLGGISIDCRCGARMEWEDVARRLNATERLSARDASDGAFAIEEKKMLTVVVNSLNAYAAALDDE